MFFLTIDSQTKFNAAIAYPFDEEVGAEFQQDIYDYLEEVLSVLPQKFHEAIREQTLFQNDILMNDYKEWCFQVIGHFNEEGDAHYKKLTQIVQELDASAQTIFEQSLHDGKVLKLTQNGDTYTLLLDMSGGFTVQSMVELTFHEATATGELKSYYIYDDLIETENGFALRVLSSSGRPYAEWTIYFKDITASYVYRPAIYVEPGDIETWADYVQQLNAEDDYFIVKDFRFVKIELLELEQTVEGIYAGMVRLGADYEEARERIYCATYEDPYAHFSEPLPVVELLEAVHSDDQTIRVRAFNTIFAVGEQVAHIVNELLREADVGEGEMYFAIMASHFNTLGCLEEDVKEKWITD